MPALPPSSSLVRRIRRWTARAALGVLILIAVAVGAVYARTALAFRRTYDVPVGSVVVPTDTASVVEGERIARIRGCEACHGDDLAGAMMHDPGPVGALLIGRMSGPNLTQKVPGYTDEQLVALLRWGVRPNGRSVLVMPSSILHHLADDDIGRLIAYLRTLPATAREVPPTSYGPLARAALALGAFGFEAAQIDRHNRPPASRPDEPAALGRYLARTSCTECHGGDLSGNPQAPGLAIAAGYTEDQFRHFLRTGEALGGRELPEMSETARSRFSHLTDGEIAALHGYLKTLGAN